MSVTTVPFRNTTGRPKLAPGAPSQLFRPWQLVLGAIGLLAAISFVHRIDGNPRAFESVWGAVFALLAFFLIWRLRTVRSGHTLYYETVLNKVHYVQLMMHICVYTYWGWYWREVYHFVPLLIAQIAFAYALDMLVCWSRRDKWILGFGPFPIILSTNLFLWFKDEWFYLQFVLIAVGVVGKEFVKWKREGRLTHIFNPSALSLFLFSVVLIATRSTGMTWGIEIATTLHRPPHIYLEIFFLGLIVQSLFQVTLVTLWSAVALYAINLLYTRATGSYNFIDSNIPVSVFLGLHLLVTDPATSPRRAPGKIVFGALYGAGVFGMYRLLVTINAPEFYDKLLCVPFLNLTVIGLDRASDFLSTKVRGLVPALRPLTPRTANYAWMAVWVVIFSVMTTTGFLLKGSQHPGGNPAFWQRACEKGAGSACTTWVRTLNADCDDNSAAACLKVGQLMSEGRVVPRNAAYAGVAFGRGCDLGSPQACSELVQFARGEGQSVFSKACGRGDGASCFILGSLYSAGQGVPKDDNMAFNLFQKSCNDGWWRGCGRLGVSYLVGQGTAVDESKAIEDFDRGCDGQNPASCMEAAKLYRQGVEGRVDEELARDRIKRACDLGLQAACQPGLARTVGER